MYLRFHTTLSNFALAFLLVSGSPSSQSPMAPSVTPPYFVTNAPVPDGPGVTSLVAALGLKVHFEGGQFSETGRDPLVIQSPFPMEPVNRTFADAFNRPGFDPALRNASTSIYYLIHPSSPVGAFHVNRARHIINVHKGRGTYVLIHPAGSPQASPDAPRVETVVVGPDAEGGEQMQLTVEGGTWAASFLLPDAGSETDSKTGMLITEVVAPGWEAWDFEFVSKEALVGLLGEKEAAELEWLLVKS